MTTGIKCLMDCSEDFRAEAAYVLKTLAKIAGFKIDWIKPGEFGSLRDAVLIYYGNNPPQLAEDIFLIQISAADYHSGLSGLSAKNVGWMKLCDDSGKIFSKNFPAQMCYLFARNSSPLERILYRDNRENEAVISFAESRMNCSADLLATAFYFLSLENERRTDVRDEHGRFNAPFSPLGQKIYQSPVIDHYVQLIANFIRFAFEKKGRKAELFSWPENKKFALVLTHDVDRIQSWTYSKIKRALRESSNRNQPLRLVKHSFQLALSLLTPENWQGNFEYISRLEEDYRGKSTFFFVAKSGDAKDPAYRLSGKKISRAISYLQERKFHSGLHGSFLSAEKDGLLSDEKAALEKQTGIKISGNRQHYLRFGLTKTPDLISAAGLKYDSTLGFSNETGFRCGSSFPVQLWNFKKKKPYDFWEIPLILMDTVLFLESKMNLSAEGAANTVEKFLKETESSGGCLTVNWHNNNISKRDVTGYTAVYEEMLNRAREQNAWICSADELIDWWEKK